MRKEKIKSNYIIKLIEQQLNRCYNFSFKSKNQIQFSQVNPLQLQMYLNKNNPSNQFINHDQQIKPYQIACRYHSGSVCLNYCHEMSCFRLLCEQCIEQHLDHHKKNSLPVTSIKSYKKIRQICVDKVSRLIQDLLGKMSTLKQPKNPQQLLQQANMKFQAIKKIMFEIIEQELAKFYQQLKSKISQSFSTLKNLQEVHDNLGKIINQLKQSRAIVLEGAKQIPETIQKILGMNQNLYIDTFTREAIGYAQKLAYVDFDISINQGKFKNSISESLRISRNQPDDSANNSGQFGKLSKLNISRPLNMNTNSMNTPVSRSRAKSQHYFQQNRQHLVIKNQSELKFLHFFQTNSSYLHLIDLSSHSIKRQRKNLPSSYLVPQFHASIMIPQGYIFLSGGIMQVGDSQMKSTRLSKYSLKAKDGDNFKKDFAKVNPRSSHSLCQYGDYLYILGGYGPQKIDDVTQPEKSVEKVNIRTGEVQIQTRSKYGGANISAAMNGYIIKASQQGVQAYNINTKKWSTIHVPENYQFFPGFGWTRISKQCIFIYGGYNLNQDGIDTCKQWIISQNEIEVINLQFKLPFKQGFLNNPGVIVDGCVYALQNVYVEDDQDQSQNIEEGERALLKFDGYSWKSINI